MRARVAARVDANQAALVEFLRRIGASVQHLHTIGQGTPDILIGWKLKRELYLPAGCGINLLAEIKDPSKSPCKRQLTPNEAKWQADWDGQVTTICTQDDCLRLLGLL